MAIDEPGLTPAIPASPPPEAQSGYPVDAEFESQRRRSRFWAIPVLGGVAKIIILIPHIVILAVLGIVFASGFGKTSAGLALWILWIPVLFAGHLPLWGYAFIGGYLRWATRFAAFLVGLTDVYPPFTMHSVDNPVLVRFRMPERSNRWWAVPLLSFYVKQLILIPHAICLAVLGLCAAVLWLVMWIPVLISGEYPRGPYDFIAGLLRWSLRVQAYSAGLTDQYPPFSLV